MGMGVGWLAFVATPLRGQDTVARDERPRRLERLKGRCRYRANCRPKPCCERITVAGCASMGQLGAVLPRIQAKLLFAQVGCSVDGMDD